MNCLLPVGVLLTALALAGCGSTVSETEREQFGRVEARAIQKRHEREAAEQRRLAAEARRTDKAATRAAEVKAPAPEPEPESESESVDPGSVSKSEYGEKWPLKVAKGRLRCEGSEGFGSVIFTAPDGTDYAINGTALADGYPEIEPIWRFEPGLEKYELRVNMSPLLERGLALCE